MIIELDEAQEEFLFEALKDAKTSMIQWGMRATIRKADPRLLAHYKEKINQYQKLEDNLAKQINDRRY
jgi:competence protein ComGF